MNDRPEVILVAEDDYLVAEEIIRELRSRGHANILEAADGLEAVEKTCELKPDVVLMDIRMPNLNGLEAAQCIQERCPTPVVILTAFESEESLDRARDVGVGAYLVKPPRAEELERAMVIARARHADLMELRRVNTELVRALAQVRQLQGILPICARCKKIREDSGSWRQIESYIREHSEAEFSHGICPDCARELYSEWKPRQNGGAA